MQKFKGVEREGGGLFFSTDPKCLCSDRENIYARVMVLVHDMSSECALQMNEVSLKYL